MVDTDMFRSRNVRRGPGEGGGGVIHTCLGLVVG